VDQPELSNIDIALYVLFQQGGSENYIHTEDVALECFRLFSAKFSWQKYPEYPDAEPARSALFDASKTKKGNLTRGNKRIGWMLTPAGVDHVRSVTETIEGILGEHASVRSARQEEDRFLNQLEKHAAFVKFLRDGDCRDIQEHEVTNFLRCSLDSGAAIVRKRAERVKTRAHAKGRLEIVEFVQRCEARYPTLFGST
jgi:hypothetical protein